MMDSELEIIIHQTAFEFLSYNEKDNALHILQNSSLRSVSYTHLVTHGTRWNNYPRG